MFFNNQCKVLVSTFPYGQNVIKCRMYSFTVCYSAFPSYVITYAEAGIS